MWFAKPKSFKVVLTYNKLSADLFICQTFFAKHLEKVNLPNILTTKLSAIRYTNWMENLVLEYKWRSFHHILVVLVKIYHLLWQQAWQLSPSCHLCLQFYYTYLLPPLVSNMILGHNICLLSDPSCLFITSNRMSIILTTVLMLLRFWETESTSL